MSCCLKQSVLTNPIAAQFNGCAKVTTCGAPKANSLGFILRDHAFSFLDVLDISKNSQSGNGCCIQKKQVCLVSPCDITQTDCDSLVSVPLVNAADGTPFVIPAGCIIHRVTVSRCALLDCTLQAMLGTLSCNSGGDNPGRFFSQDCFIQGGLLNNSCQLAVNVAANNPTNFVNCTDCTTPGPVVPCTIESGEPFDTLVAITVISGTLHAADIRVTIELSCPASGSCQLATNNCIACQSCSTC